MRGILGLLSLLATATIPLLMQRYLGPVLYPSAPNLPTTAPSLATPVQVQGDGQKSDGQTSNRSNRDQGSSDQGSSDQSSHSQSGDDQRTISIQGGEVAKPEGKGNLGDLLRKRLQENWNRH